MGSFTAGGICGLKYTIYWNSQTATGQQETVQHKDNVVIFTRGAKSRWKIETLENRERVL